MCVLTSVPGISLVCMGNFRGFSCSSLGRIPVLGLLAACIAAAPRKAGAVVGSVAVAALLLTTFWTYRNYYFDNWRGAMTVIAAEQEPGDRVLCFPVTECTVAVKNYLPGNESPSGGMVLTNQPGAISFFPQGVSWSGYRTKKLYGSAAWSAT
mgnify:CR=1 FL=1